MFKTLVGTAAVAIIAYVGYFFWGVVSADWQKQRAAEAAVATVEMAADNACRLAAANMAAFLRGDLVGQRFVQYDERLKLRTCVAEGRLQLSDVAAFDL